MKLLRFKTKIWLVMCSTVYGHSPQLFYLIERIYSCQLRVYPFQINVIYFITVITILVKI